MLTFYTVVRGFQGEFDRIQRNAVGSWLRVPGAEILLLGKEEPGAAEFAKEMGLPIYPLERDEHGIPLLGDALEHGEGLASYPVRCFVNSDIIILPTGFQEALRIATGRFDKFLLSARRWNFDHEIVLDFGDDWEMALECQVKEHGQLYRKVAIDILCHNGVDWGKVPPFAVGRTCTDNWQLERALKDGATFVDATPVCTIVHQSHSVTRKPEEREGNVRLYKKTQGVQSDKAMHKAKRGFGDAHWKITETGELEKLDGKKVTL